MTPRTWVASLFVLCLACESPVDRPPPPENDGIHGFANGCYAMDATDPGSTDTRWIAVSETGDAYAFTAREQESGARFFLKASGLGTYLLYDQDEQYLLARDGALVRQDELLSDVSTIDDTFESDAEWEIQVSTHDAERFQVRHLHSGSYLTRLGLSPNEAEAAVVAFYPTTGCAEFPELTVDAEGDVTRTRFDDGDLFGFVDTHSHILTNFSFGGGGIFHGAPFHALGVEHALSDCSRFHGGDGRRDLFGYAYDRFSDVDADSLLMALISGRTPEFNHHTAGFPDFTEWPAQNSSTHQTQYYRWLERAWRGGLRLVVQHATSNRVICELIAGAGTQRVRYSCNDMVAVDRIIEETYAMERYIDAQSGGPGRGFFRIVTSPSDAREVIANGGMAVLLGIETSNVFDCFLVPPEGTPACDPARVTERLDHYHDLGVRVVFPVHKFDNAFSAGDGHKSFIEAGNFVNSGHWSSFTEDCPAIPTTFDRGGLTFPGLNMPRDDYFAPAPNDLSLFPTDPIAALSPYLRELGEPAVDGDWCQSSGLTPLGETLIEEMMQRGMIIELDHLPRRAYIRAFEMLEAADYPGAAGTHGLNNEGRLYALGGISKTGLGRCQVTGDPGAMAARLTERVQLIRDNGGYPAEGFGFDLNGFAGAPSPRFGDRAGCSDPQENPITYPFMSYGGDMTFTEPRVGNRTLDFNTEGFVHIGMVPELIEDARRTGVTDEALEPLFRSAEGYIRMWEAAEARAGEL